MFEASLSTEQAIGPIIIGGIVSLFTIIISKRLDSTADERRRSDDGRRAEDHDIRQENKLLREELKELNDKLNHEQAKRLIIFLRNRELKQVIMEAGLEVPVIDSRLIQDALELDLND